MQQIESSKDFLFAKKELLNVQEMQMKIALQNEREKTKLEMLEEIETIKRMSEMELGLQRQGFEDRIRQLNRTLVCYYSSDMSL